MKKQYLLALGFSFLCLTAVQGCQQLEEVTIETTQLVLGSEEILQFSDEAAEQRVAVTANKNWIALPSQPWVSAHRDGDQLVVRVMANPSTETRRAQVQINAGDQTRSLVVEQQAKALAFSAQKAVRFGQFGGERRFYVDASDKTWQIVSETPWITVRQRTNQGEIFLKVDETKSREERQGRVVVKDGNGTVVHEMAVEQDAILYYYLPYPEFGASAEAIREFETERYSRVVTSPDFISNFTNWIYKTVSPIFEFTRYNVVNGRYIGAQMYTTGRSTAPLVTQNEKGGFDLNVELVEYLNKHGYRNDDKGSEFFYNADLNSRAEISWIGTTPHINFSFIPPQEKAYPTFETLPLGVTNFFITEVGKPTSEDDDEPLDRLIVHNEGYEADELIDLHTRDGWTFIAPYDPTAPENAGDSWATREKKRDEYSRKKSHPLFYGAKNKNPEHFRAFYERLVFEKDGEYIVYRLDNRYERYINTFITPDIPEYDELYGQPSWRVSGSRLASAQRTFLDVTKFFFRYEGAIYITQEFRDLLAREGFAFEAFWDREQVYVYYNKEKNLEFAFKLGNAPVDGEKKPGVVIVQVQPRNLDYLK